MTAGAFLVATVFLACAVEAVEALTIVLAVGTTRGWRSTLQGMAAGLLVLAVVIAAFGPALTVLPLDSLRLIVGGLLLVFGLQWLRKAILRAGGFKARHDETARFAREVDAARAAGADEQRFISDGYAFALAFKGVLLEGLEVAFIVVTFGANQGRIPLAVLGAVLAVVVVATAGIAVRAPLARVPENSMKFTVGVMLTSFGTFWGAEGAGVDWPGGDAALLGVLAFVLIVSAAAIHVLRRLRGPGGGTTPVTSDQPAAAQ
ncbi:MAG: hypothetical protein H0T85_10870 [Geodermatophilaceae bacterium]|nr:hypothetical protein [Geodermatophilaceae bacterium]